MSPQVKTAVRASPSHLVSPSSTRYNNCHNESAAGFLPMWTRNSTRFADSMYWVRIEVREVCLHSRTRLCGRSHRSRVPESELEMNSKTLTSQDLEQEGAFFVDGVWRKSWS
jgi:hypothetical protein